MIQVIEKPSSALLFKRPNQASSPKAMDVMY